MSRQCAILTLEDLGDFQVYDSLIYPPMRDLGWVCVEVPWSQPDVDWRKFDAVVVRSCWDYHNHRDAFLATLEKIESCGIPLFNSAGICRWNSDKRYLMSLMNRGVPVVPTIWMPSFDQESVELAFEQFDDCEKIVIKPTIGANADHTFVIHNHTAQDRRIQASFEQRPGMIQPFLNSIASEGEYSLFYFGGQCSHAICKKPKQGDFRVQEEHGGSFEAIVPDHELLQIGQKAISAIDETLLYARVDLARLADNTLAVMELELVEPSLYFVVDQASPARFVQAFQHLFDRYDNMRTESKADDH